MSELTPREIVAELDKYIIGQNQAKRMVAIAVRNRWRRQRLAAELRNEVAPRNIIMMGPTGVGKTEIARRLAKLCSAPFIKVEATKYTEVGYVGRDVESMIRDLMEIGINLVRAEEAEKVKGRAEAAAEERLLDLLLPSGDGRENTREKLRELFRQGFLDDREVEFEVKEQSQPIGMLGVPGMEQLGDQMKGAFSKLFPQKTHRKKMKVGAAWRHLIEDESSKLVDEDKITDLARERVEQMGIVFIDEIDKLASGSQQRSADISREGVQRDLLPIVEGSAVNTKYGLVNTDHILFIAAGAFHVAKVTDLIPELQGRFPVRVNLKPLTREDFKAILSQTDNALTRQYEALLAVDLQDESEIVVLHILVHERRNQECEFYRLDRRQHGGRVVPYFAWLRRRFDIARCRVDAAPVFDPLGGQVVDRRFGHLAYILVVVLILFLRDPEHYFRVGILESELDGVCQRVCRDIGLSGAAKQQVGLAVLRLDVDLIREIERNAVYCGFGL